jgi:hypothetical protein
MFDDGRDVMMQHMRRRSTGSSIRSDDAFIKEEDALQRSTCDDEVVVENEMFNDEGDTCPNGASMEGEHGCGHGKLFAYDQKGRWRKVYALHFMFMWNTRTYEYASVGCSVR